MAHDSQAVGPKKARLVNGDLDQVASADAPEPDAIATNAPNRFIPRVAAHSKRSLQCLQMLKEYE